MEKINQEQVLAELLRVHERNKAIAVIMGFKKYVPATIVQNNHKIHYKDAADTLEWYFLPGVGRYCSMELKFHSDYNWLIEACIALKKYENTFNGIFQKKEHSVLFQLYYDLRKIKLTDINKEKLWMLVGDFCLEILKQKQDESSSSGNNR